MLSLPLSILLPHPPFRSIPFHSSFLSLNIAEFRGRNSKYPPLWKCLLARTSLVQIYAELMCSSPGVNSHSLVLSLIEHAHLSPSPFLLFLSRLLSAGPPSLSTHASPDLDAHQEVR
jgi:hypothetical protein